MINEEVMAKILQHQARGFDRVYIQRFLIENGAHPTDIYDTFNHLEEQKNATQIIQPIQGLSWGKIILIAGLMFVVFLFLVIGLLAIFL